MVQGYFCSSAAVLGTYSEDGRPFCDEIFQEHKDCAEPPQRIPIESVVIHPEWKGSKEGVKADIALIRLGQAIERTGNNCVISVFFRTAFIYLL